MGDALVAFAFIDKFNQQAPENERIRVTNNSWSQYISSRALDAAVRNEKRASDDRVYGQTVCAYDDQLYVMGAAWFEPDQRLFRTTEMETSDDPDDKPDDPDNKPDEESDPDKKSDPTPSKNEKSSQAKRAALPKTDDPSNPQAMVLLAAAGLVLVAFSRVFRKVRL